MHLSAACKRGIAQHYRTPREREEFARELRRVDSILDSQERRAERETHDKESKVFDEMQEGFESVVYDLNRRGEITRGARIVSLSHSPQ